MLYILIYIFIAVSRIGYPFHLEWMEGGSLEHVRRILAGQQLYVPPSLDFVPYIYPPLYFYLSAMVAALLSNDGFLPLRLVSFLASLGSLAVIFLLVKRETGHFASALLASGLFAAAFKISGAWLDIARVDSLYLFWFLLGVYLMRWHQSLWGGILAGICLACSFFTKQTALFAVLPVLGFYVYITRWRWGWCLGTFFVLSGGITLLLNELHRGWYWYYLFDLPGQHALVSRMLLLFWAHDIMLPLAIALSLGIFYFGCQLSEGRLDQWGYYLFLGMGMLGSSWVSKMHSGAYQNVLLPACAFLSLLFGLAVSRVEAMISRFPKDAQLLLSGFLSLVCGIQFLALLYDPFDNLPSAQDREAGERIVAELSGIDGDVFLPRHGYLALLAGKRNFAQELAVQDVLRGANSRQQIKERLISEQHTAFAQHRFQAIVLDHAASGEINTYYTTQKRLFEHDTIFWPVTGIQTRPEFMYIPR